MIRSGRKWERRGKFCGSFDCLRWRQSNNGNKFFFSWKTFLYQHFNKPNSPSESTGIQTLPVLTNAETQALAAAVLNVSVSLKLTKVSSIFIIFQKAQRNSIFPKSQSLPAKEADCTGDDGLSSDVSQCQSVEIRSRWVSWKISGKLS